MATSTRETFSDTFNQPLNSKYAHTSLSDRHLRIEQGPVTTFEQWKSASMAREPALNLDLPNTESIYSQMEQLGEFTPRVEMWERPLRHNPVPRENPNNTTHMMATTTRPRPLHGYTGFSQGSICNEIVPKLSCVSDSESSLRQDLSMNMGGTLTVGYNFSTYAPTMAASSSQRVLMDAVTHKRRFSCTEKSFRRSESSFVKHGALAKKFARQDNMNSLAMNMKGGLKKGGKKNITMLQQPWHYF